MKLFDPSHFRKPLGWVLAATTLAMAQGTPTDRLLWLLSRFDTVPGAGGGSIAHCERMERLQRELMSLRDSVSALGATGRERRASCRDSACLGSLQTLRDSLKAVSGRESASRQKLGQETSLCPAPIWSRWLRSRTLDSLLQADPELSSTPGGRALAEERAELAWTGELERLLRGGGRSGSGLDPHVARRFADPQASCKWRLRRAFHLEWTGNRDSALAILGRISSEASLCPREASVACHRLGSEASLPDSVQMALLAGTLHQADLRPRSLLELAFLLAADSRWGPAFDSLAAALSSQPDLLSPVHVDSLARWADQAGFDPLDRLDASTPWLDRLLIARCRLLLATGRGRKAQGLLADFRLRFPASNLGDEARELLASSRR